MDKKNIAVFASGSGSNFQALAEACRDNVIPGRIVALVCDRPDAGVIERAREFNDIEIIALSPRDCSSKEDYEDRIISRLSGYDISLVCLAGYMRICGSRLLGEFRNRIINIHPSLLPSFKGAHAIKDAFEYGVKVFGVTIHYVDESLDGGKIIDQTAFSYYGDDLELLTEMIHGCEHPLYINTVKRLLQQ